MGRMQSLSEGNFRELDESELAFISGGGEDEFVGYYQTENEVVAVYLDSDTGNQYDVWVSNDGGNMGWDYAGPSNGFDSGGYFGSLSGGMFGVTGGVAVGTNPVDIYGFGGVGTGGLSVTGGHANDTEGYLTGTSASAAAIGGFGTSLDGQYYAALVGTPQASVTYGVDLTDPIANTANSIYGQFYYHAEVMAQGFIDTYYPDPNAPPPGF